MQLSKKPLGVRCSNSINLHKNIIIYPLGLLNRSKLYSEYGYRKKCLEINDLHLFKKYKIIGFPPHGEDQL